MINDSTQDVYQPEADNDDYLTQTFLVDCKPEIGCSCVFSSTNIREEVSSNNCLDLSCTDAPRGVPCHHHHLDLSLSLQGLLTNWTEPSPRHVAVLCYTFASSWA